MLEVEEKLTRDEVKGRLIPMLSEISGIDEGRINEDTNFYQLGLDSLSLASLDVSVDEEFGFDLEDHYDSVVAANTFLGDSVKFHLPREAVTDVRRVVDYIHRRYNSD